MGEEIFDEDDDGRDEVQEPITVSSDTEPGGGGLVKPVDDLKEVAELYEQFEKIKDDLLTSDDIETIQDRPFITKSGWRKIATAFNVSVDVIDTERVVEDGVVIWRVKARAVAPNGKSAESYGTCSSNESAHMETLSETKGFDEDDDDVLKVDGNWRRLKEPKEVNDHNILATAETRAKNRAISDLVGGGQVSSEEVTSKEDIFN